MNLKKFFRNLGIFSLIVLIVYFFLSAEPLGKELSFNTVWIKPFSQIQDVAISEQAEPLPFSTKDRFGYFTKDGKILLLKEKTARVSITNDSFAEYTSEQPTSIVYDTTGKIKFELKNPTNNQPLAGYPLLTFYRNYVFTPGGDEVYCFDKAGNFIWKRKSSAVITAFNNSRAGTILGYSDGNLTFIDNDGNEVFSFTPGGNTHPIIYGCDISQDGTYASCVTGLDKQRIVLIKITNNQHKIVYHEFLPYELRRSVFVKIDDKNDAIYYERKDGLGIINRREENSTVLEIPGKLLSLGSEADTTLTVALNKDNSEYVLSVLEYPHHLLAETRFTTNNASLLQADNSFYLITDEAIARIDILEK